MLQLNWSLTHSVNIRNKVFRDSTAILNLFPFLRPLFADLGKKPTMGYADAEIRVPSTGEKKKESQRFFSFWAWSRLVNSPDYLQTKTAVCLDANDEVDYFTCGLMARFFSLI